MAAYTVTTLEDFVPGQDVSIPGSLREAIILANANPDADLIEFSPSLVTGTVTLKGNELLITENLTILGAGITVSGNNSSRVFNIDNYYNQIEVAIDAMTITNGFTYDGGGILNQEKTTITNSTISRNIGSILQEDGSSSGRGGGIRNRGTLHLVNSTVSENSASSGGGIDNFAGELVVTNSTISGNVAAIQGGGISSKGNYSNVNITNVTIAENFASSGGGLYSSSRGTATITNTIIAKNSNEDFTGIFTENSIGNIIGDSDNLNLGHLDNNGGPTRTHALFQDSIAINAGSNERIPADSVDLDRDGNKTEQILYDQRGTPFLRVIGEKVDIGAYEFSPLTPPPEFNAVQYGASYDDLITAFGYNLQALTEHYLNLGRAEGRSSDLFDEYRYVASNPDLIASPAIADPTTRSVNSDGAAEHYIRYGADEGRSLTRFASDRYLASYGDLIEAFGYNLTSASIHYIESGLLENRAPGTFDEYRYLAGYDELLGVYGTNVVAATEHYIRFGYFEPGRDPLAFKPDIYLASYSDLIDAVKASTTYADKLAFASQHYVRTGWGEGRARAIFEPASYLAKNPDVATDPFYKSDPARHYIEYGYFEDRPTM